MRVLVHAGCQCQQAALTLELFEGEIQDGRATGRLTVACPHCGGAQYSVENVPVFDGELDFLPKYQLLTGTYSW